MTDDKKDIHKIRFKFANGEEFEAEGSLDFVEKQRDYFLSLVKKKPLSATLSIPAITRRVPMPNAPATHISAREDTAISGTLAPLSPAPTENSNLKRATQEAAFVGAQVWEQLLTQEGEILYLRRKFHLPPDEAALILLAGGKELLGKPGCSALWLSRALEKSGFSVGRLDRLLAPALKLNFLLCQGSKRSRQYMLTPTGLAHAFVVAEKKVQTLL